ncbi:acylneuraminate cytidylyltransferase family protein [Lutibacter sp. TH_r2]|uniref:acylneuraminate cytidylyltransferase family protein n=1 Tax=Lutibacter sp. TH_r2 TaxID=3082083 RepID=UPI002955C38A|nr:acylneuraminate cytidylyltransferase family protein [Lutibacter sp. TH_r2]MDV7187450.1 acylneuraminate cytidylyltransferase family protein [Lutibacter sp. TH_r2]
MRVLGIIPARGGSKGVPRKNIRLIQDKPLIAYSIETSLKSELLTDVFVATDDDEICAISKKYNCSVFKRNCLNAQDNSPIEDVLLEMIEKLGDKYDLIILLQPTAPLRTNEDIDNVIKMFIEDSTLTNVISVVELNDIHPARMYSKSNNEALLPLEKENERSRRQDLTPVYLRNGCIYAITTKEFLLKKTLITDTKKAYVMPETKWANIDTERDLKFVEFLMKSQRD